MFNRIDGYKCVFTALSKKDKNQTTAAATRVSY